MTDHDADNIGWAARWAGAPCIDNPQLWDGETRTDADEAARQCVAKGCPYIAACLANAMQLEGTERKRYTVRGAATANQRRRIHERSATDATAPMA